MQLELQEYCKKLKALIVRAFQIPRYKNELKLFNKAYKNRHFRYNFWKYVLNNFKRQKDIFTQKERIEIYNMIKKLT